jgi:uncharacterized protein
VTGGLDDTQLRKLAERLSYLRELEARRGAILASITEQGKMTDAWRASIAGAVTKAELEDIYLPYKPKRRTKAMIAREAGLAAAAATPFWRTARRTRSSWRAYLSEALPDTKTALEGARDILAEGCPKTPPFWAGCATTCAGRAAGRQGVRGKEAEGGQVLGLFRPYREMGARSPAPGLGHAARPERGIPDHRP